MSTGIKGVVTGFDVVVDVVGLCVVVEVVLDVACSIYFGIVIGVCVGFFSVFDCFRIFSVVDTGTGRSVVVDDDDDDVPTTRLLYTLSMTNGKGGGKLDCYESLATYSPLTVEN